MKRITLKAPCEGILNKNVVYFPIEVTDEQTNHTEYFGLTCWKGNYTEELFDEVKREAVMEFLPDLLDCMSKEFASYMLLAICLLTFEECEPFLQAEK